MEGNANYLKKHQILFPCLMQIGAWPYLLNENVGLEVWLENWQCSGPPRCPVILGSGAVVAPLPLNRTFSQVVH